MVTNVSLSRYGVDIFIMGYGKMLRDVLWVGGRVGGKFIIVILRGFWEA